MRSWRASRPGATPRHSCDKMAAGDATGGAASLRREAQPTTAFMSRTLRSKRSNTPLRFEPGRLTLSRELRESHEERPRGQARHGPERGHADGERHLKPTAGMAASIALTLGMPLRFFSRSGAGLISVENCHFRHLRPSSQLPPTPRPGGRLAARRVPGEARRARRAPRRPRHRPRDVRLRNRSGRGARHRIYGGGGGWASTPSITSPSCSSRTG